MSVRPHRIRLHIENLRSQPPVFHITPERFEDACRRHPDLAARLDTTTCWDNETFDRDMRTAEVLIGWRFPHDRFAERAPHLRWIQMTGAGIEHVMPLDWLPPEATLTNNAGVHAFKAGEFIAMGILALNTRLPFFATNKERRRWDKFFATAVPDKTLVVIGVGHMGTAGAERAKGLGMRVIGVRASGRPSPHVNEMVTPDRLHEVLPRADILLVSVPLTRETRGMLGRRELDLLKPEAGLINVARAGVVDYAALAEKLHAGELSGAILDVFDPEPLPADSFLWDTPNLILTPHVSSDDAERYIPLTLDFFFENLDRYLLEQPLRNAVDRARWY